MLNLSSFICLAAVLALGVGSAGAQAARLALPPVKAVREIVRPPPAFPVTIGPFGLRVTGALGRFDPFGDDDDLGGVTLGAARRAGDLREAGLSAVGGVDVGYALPGRSGWFPRPYVGPRVYASGGVAWTNGGYFVTTAAQVGLGAGVSAEYRLAPGLVLALDGGVDAYARPVFGEGEESSSFVFGTVASSRRDLDRFAQRPPLVAKVKFRLTREF